ncbi:MAG: MBL fold metallo-hydrolase [Planctomycetaceae bacterium]|nr:MBL fold metallo-hydrolase [Planctomycetaceae bacterium]
MKQLLFLLTFLLFVPLIAVAFAETEPGFQAIWHTKIGEIDFYCIQDALLEQDAPHEFDTALLLTEDKETLNRLVPNGKTPGGFSLFVVKKGPDVVLIDTGVSGKIPERLQSLGIKPGDVKAVLLTHSHGDHVGGLIRDSRKNFPNAVIWLDPREMTFWKSATNHNLLEQCLKLYGEPKLLTPDEKTAVIFPEMVAVDLSGHTPGHTGFLISSGDSGNTKLLVGGDLLHIGAVQFARPDISIRFDDNPAQAAAIRQKTLQRAADEKWLFAAVHLLPFPPVGSVKAEGGGFRFEPVAGKPVPTKSVK